MYGRGIRLLCAGNCRFTCRRNQHQSRPVPAAKPKQVSRTNVEAIRPVQHLLQDGSIIVSTSTDILDNLCLEEWIYRHYDFSQSNEQILLLWRNHPAVVVGRHQNLWSEVAVEYCRNAAINIVRRNSGGGAVYHDLENLNLSFLTSKKCYDRRRNLAIVGDVLRHRFAIHTEISPREDLIISGTGEKVSGTASKLNAYNSYHHCTLLVDVDRTALRSSLRRTPIAGFSSNATKSVPSPVLNLRSLNASLTIDALIEQLHRHQPRHSALHFVDPTDGSLFADIATIRAQFSTWQWVFGKSPKFTLTSTFQFDGESIQLTLLIEKGLLASVTFSTASFDHHLKDVLESTLVGTQFEQRPLVDSLARFKATNRSDVNSVLLDTVAVAVLNRYRQCL